MKTFEINDNSIFEIDKALEGQDLRQYELEIEKIIDNLWSDIGQFEELISPFFIVSLRSIFLPSLYINYLSLHSLQSKYDFITLKTSTSIIDIIAKKLNFDLHPKRRILDLEFNLSDEHFLNIHQQSGPFWKRALREVKRNIYFNLAKINRIDVLYLNAGKLGEELSSIPNSFDASLVYDSMTNKNLPDLDMIKDKAIKNITGLDLSIPSPLVLELLEKKVFKFLDAIFIRIFSLSEFIDKNQVRLVISSASTHEAFLCLIAAAKITKTDSFIVPHGFVTLFNHKLNNYPKYQGTLNDFEPKLKGVQQVRFKTNWFEKKI